MVGPCVNVLFYGVEGLLGSYESAVKFDGVMKRIGGRVILRGVSFGVRRGEVFGLIGPNGAGKTTSLRIAAGILRPDNGRVFLFDRLNGQFDPGLRVFVGYLPEDAGAYRNMRGIDFIRFIAKIYAAYGFNVEDMVDEATRISNLGDRLWDRIKTYSKGMRRRLLLAVTLMTKPKLAILDEPNSGLDVYHTVRMRNAILEYVRRTRGSVLLSSHNMLEVEYLCDRVALISSGRIIDTGTPGELKKKYGAENLEEAFVRALNQAGEGVEVLG